MTTLLFALAFTVLTDDSEQLRTYFEPISLSGSQPPAIREVVEQIGYSCDVFPKTLTVGDRMYIKVAGRNLTRHPLEYTCDPSTLGADKVGVGYLLTLVSIERNRKEDYVSRNVTLPGYIPGLYPREVLQPGKTLESNLLPFFVPNPDGYGRQFWVWDDFDKEEKMLLRFRIKLHTYRREDTDDYTTEKMVLNTVGISQEVLVKPRPTEELQLIKEWYDKVRLSIPVTPQGLAKCPSPNEWKEFEEKLTPGTLRNYVRMMRILVEIFQDENRGKRQEMVDEMLKWIDELHPLEKEGLTRTAYEIIKNRQSNGFGVEITVPAVGD